MAGKTKIMLVDDEALFTDLYSERLKLAGFEVAVENHADKAIESIRKFTPDLILLDLMMPLVSGEEILDQLKADNELKNIKVIILTALANTGSERAELEKKADKYFVKSETMPKDLVEKIEAMI